MMLAEMIAALFSPWDAGRVHYQQLTFPLWELAGAVRRDRPTSPTHPASELGAISPPYWPISPDRRPTSPILNFMKPTSPTGELLQGVHALRLRGQSLELYRLYHQTTARRHPHTTLSYLCRVIYLFHRHTTPCRHQSPTFGVLSHLRTHHLPQMLRYLLLIHTWRSRHRVTRMKRSWYRCAI
jgi:hypothetical protein